ncbi:NAD(P)/FAD-dependent oxidoreductase [Halobaculum sp. MBLA0147]|uniref:NAD(P)/FAD-dependent oxidoreductase n=1 Tax=Halobaculum sp. MBLA0147 TaxID=3079934 RepID=UPI0035239FC1
MHVAVLGAGYAGLGVTRRLEDALPPSVDITLVNDGPEHVLTHEVHRAIRRPAVADAITVPLAEVLDRATLVTDPVADLDAEAGVVETTAGQTLSYDYGALCFGSETAYYGIEGLRDHAHPLKTLDDAAAIREDALATIERGGDLVVGGAGLSGVQVAGELAALAREENAAVPEDVSITLVEQLETVAPNFPANFRRAVHDALVERGVDVRTETTVERVDDDAVYTDGGASTDGGDHRDGDDHADGESHADDGRLTYDTLVWTGGIAGRAPTEGERPVVRADLRLTDRTLALGDAARVVDTDGEAVPASASAAIREAKTAATNLERLVESDDDGFRPRLDRYRFDVPGWLVSVGDGAVAQLGPTVLTGAAAKAAKTTVGAGYLTTVGAIRQARDLAEAELAE